MVNEPEVIREQMMETRSCLEEKLETLECRLADAAESITDSAKETANTVRDSVHDSVRTIQNAFDVKRQVERQPWVAVAVSVGAGYVCGRLLEDHGSHAIADKHFTTASRGLSGQGNGPAPGQGQTGSRMKHALSSLEPDISRIKELGLGIAFGIVRDFVRDIAAPSLKNQFGDIIDDITTRLGGKPLPSPVFEGLQGEDKSAPRRF